MYLELVGHLRVMPDKRWVLFDCMIERYSGQITASIEVATDDDVVPAATMSATISEKSVIGRNPVIHSVSSRTRQRQRRRIYSLGHVVTLRCPSLISEAIAMIGVSSECRIKRGVL